MRAPPPSSPPLFDHLLTALSGTAETAVQTFTPLLRGVNNTPHYSRKPESTHCVPIYHGRSVRRGAAALAHARRMMDARRCRRIGSEGKTDGLQECGVSAGRGGGPLALDGSARYLTLMAIQISNPCKCPRIKGRSGWNNQTVPGPQYARVTPPPPNPPPHFTPPSQAEVFD
ncbi:hypothetical protein J6590_041389 [Homalodisca vitripennis]|nr:hypothetical protein J6590_041389 [Homalodisca vitripennis]